ncbi:MAG: ABC transporter ATP-binding protein [Tessaracoccus sp.]|uniref:ABC transporter ATP-binding protein n=1 Tax=Tessaracoccus sp. TaxID=1971211 RepID=UPI001EB3FCDC|nr:ABC transporter ATP-binding protein [Tessaracoccus sp.]MBK7822767.1 ABC transporter ATP-binding protein [Tessaracoccus sp.]
MAEALRVDAGVAARGVRVALSVAPGEVLALIGPNGAGKSTSIQLVAGALRPDDGEVAIGAATVADAKGFIPANRRRIGYLEQRPLLFPHLSVLDNVAYGPRSRGVGKAEARARAERELAAVGLSGFERRRPRELSGGQAQRVALARALAVDPDVVLLDEPFAALDASATPELRRVLRDRLRGITTLLVTHDPLDVLVLADRVAYLDAGRVAESGAVEDVFQRPGTPFLADFVGLNLLHGTAEDDGAVRLDGGAVIAGLAESQLPAGPARAVFPPGAVSIFPAAPHGSPRNELPAVVAGVEDRGLVQRVSLLVGGQPIHADVTPSALRELSLADGTAVVAVVKATQVALHPSRQ